MNNLALFVTHNVFLTKAEIQRVLSGEEVTTLGHCVPVWVDAKTGRTTEPAEEIFCTYILTNAEERKHDVEVIPRKGFKVFLPRSDWSPPEEIDYEKISSMTSSERLSFLKERDKWWFNNPRPPDVENLKGGYIRFEVKKLKQKTAKRTHSTQHVVEIADIERLEGSLTS